MLDQVAPTSCPYVDLDGDFYKLVGDFDKRFPEGAPSLREARLAAGRRATGPSAAACRSWATSSLERPDGAKRVDPGTVLSSTDPVDGAVDG